MSSTTSSDANERSRVILKSQIAGFEQTSADNRPVAPVPLPYAVRTIWRNPQVTSQTLVLPFLFSLLGSPVVLSDDDLDLVRLDIIGKGRTDGKDVALLRHTFGEHFPTLDLLKKAMNQLPDTFTRGLECRVTHLCTYCDLVAASAEVMRKPYEQVFRAFGGSFAHSSIVAGKCSFSFAPLTSAVVCHGDVGLKEIDSTPRWHGGEKPGSGRTQVTPHAAVTKTVASYYSCPDSEVAHINLGYQGLKKLTVHDYQPSIDIANLQFDKIPSPHGAEPCRPVSPCYRPGVVASPSPPPKRAARERTFRPSDSGPYSATKAPVPDLLGPYELTRAMPQFPGPSTANPPVVLEEMRKPEPTPQVSSVDKTSSKRLFAPSTDVVKL